MALHCDLGCTEYPYKLPTKKLCAFIRFHCFNISKHISISVLFFIISASCFVAFTEFSEIITQGWNFSTIFFAPGIGVSQFSLCPRGGGGIGPFKKLPRSLPGGWSGLVLTNT